MRIIVKFLWNSLIEKKARTLLVLFSIAASASLIFANEGFKSTVSYMFYEADTRSAGNSDIRIDVKQEVGSEEWMNTNLLDPFRNDFTYANSFLQEDALYATNVQDMCYFKIYGVNMEEFQQHNPFELKEGNYLDWSGYKVIMGEAYAKKFGLQVGDRIPLEMNGLKNDFTIVGIAKQQGIYLRELADGGILFAPKDTLAKIFGGDANLIYIKVKDMNRLADIYRRLTTALPQYEVNYALNPEIIQAETSNYVLPFRISSMAVLFMSIFIIFTGFGLITTERIASLGTIRSLGATRWKLNRILITESAVIGVIGGLFGCVFGIGVLTFIKNMYFQNDGTFSNSAPIIFGLKEIMITVIAAVLITTGSAIISIGKTTKLQIKEIILHQPDQRVTKKSRLWFIGILLFAACIIIPQFLTINLISMITAGLLEVGVLIGLIFSIPWIVRILAELAGKLGLPEEVYLGIRNIRDSKALAGNLKLFSAMIAIVAFMVTIFNTLSSDLHSCWDRYFLYDVNFSLRSSNEESLNRVKAVKGVSDAEGFYVSFSSELPDYGTFINSLYGIEDISFFDMYAVGELDKAEKAVASLNQGKNIITTQILKSKYKLNLGDTLRVKCGDKIEKYTITGFVDTNLGIGHIGYISGDNYRKLTGAANYDNFVVKGSVSPEELKLNLKREFNKDLLSINTKKEMEQANADKIDSIFKAINIYTYFAVIVGMLGMMNNIMAGFIERKRSLALYRCIGMSKKGISRMLLAEAITLGVLGSLLGLGSAITMMSTIPQIVGIMWGAVAVKPAVVEISVLCIAGLLAMILVSALPLRKSGKISIMDSMRYE